MLKSPGNSKENINCKRQSHEPVVTAQSATPSSRLKIRAHYRRSQWARAKQLKVIMQGIDFDIQQKVAKANSKNMRLISNTTWATTLNPTFVQSEQHNRPALTITSTMSPAPHRSRRGNAPSSRLSNCNTPSSCEEANSKGRLRGQMICGRGVRYSVGGRRECEDCGYGVTYGIDYLLCPACHRTLVQDADCSLRNGYKMPSTTVDSYRLLTVCLYARADCFYSNFNILMKSSTKRRCAPCGARSTQRLHSTGQCHYEYQDFFNEE